MVSVKYNEADRFVTNSKLTLPFIVSYIGVTIFSLPTTDNEEPHTFKVTNYYVS